MREAQAHKVLKSILLSVPSASHIVKDDGRREARVGHLAKYMIEKAKRRDGLYISKDGNGLVLYYKVVNEDKDSFKDMIEDVKLAFKVIGLSRVPAILKRQKHVKAMQPIGETYYYCWFMGVDPDYRGAENNVIVELRDYIYNKADEEKLPIYTETAIRRNMIVYKRYQFDILRTWETPEGDTMWFMKREPRPIEVKEKA